MMHNESSIHARRPKGRSPLRWPLVLCCALILHLGCVFHETVTTIAFSPDGTEVAYLCEAHFDEAAVDGKTLSTTIALRRCRAGSSGSSPWLTIDRVSGTDAGYASVPIEVITPSSKHLTVQGSAA